MTLASLALLVFSTACIRADMGVSVKDDGTGTITLIEAIDQKAFADSMKQFGDMLGSGASSPLDIFSEKDVDRSKLPDGSKVESYKDGNFVGVKIMAPFSKPEDVLPTLNKVARALDSTGDLSALSGGSSSKPNTGSGTRPGATPTPTKSSSSGQTPADAFEKFTIAKTDAGWRFEAVAKSVGSTGVGDDQMSQALMGMVLKDASVTFSLRLPGKVTQTNADSNKNGELKWNLPLASAQPKTMTAVTSGSGTSSSGDEDGGLPILLIVGVVVAVVVIGGLYYMSKHKQAAPPAPPIAPPPAAPTV